MKYFHCGLFSTAKTTKSYPCIRKKYKRYVRAPFASTSPTKSLSDPRLTQRTLPKHGTALERRTNECRKRGSGKDQDKRPTAQELGAPSTYWVRGQLDGKQNEPGRVDGKVWEEGSILEDKDGNQIVTFHMYVLM